MSRILIADVGSTKGDWSIIDTLDNSAQRIVAQGLNPIQASEKERFENIEDVYRKLHSPEIDTIYYYGAGCVGEAKEYVRDTLRHFWNDSEINVESDMLGAARALFGEAEGIACILGTGSNTCLYRDGEIVSQIPSLGYILGDEGSGAALGKRLLNAVFKCQLPNYIRDEFESLYSLSPAEVIQKVYRGPSPSSFLASFSPFLLSHLDCEEVKELVEEEFNLFFQRNILSYPESREGAKIGFIGSIAYHYGKQLKACASTYNLEISAILNKPITSLENYHSEKLPETKEWAKE